MKKLKIEIDILIFVLIEALSLMFFFKTSLLNLVIGTIFGIILIFITNKIKINKLIKIILLLASILLFLTIINKITSFISFNILRNYPSFIITFTFILSALYLAKRGFHTYTKALEISAYFFLFLKLATFILIIPNINISNFNIQLIKETTLDINIFYIALSFLLLNLSIKYLTNKKIHITSYLISSINPLLIKLLTILVMGETLLSLYDYPYVNIFKRIKYFDFIERMEGILSFEYLFSFFFLASFFIIVIYSIIKDILIKD